MDFQGFSKKRKLDADTVETKKLCIRNEYCLPTTAGDVDQVLTSLGGNVTSWEDVTPTESKGDLLYFSSLPRQFSYSDGSTLRNLANTTGNLGSLTIPANSMQVGDVYTLKVIGQLRASTTTGPIFFRFQTRSDAQVLADSGDVTVSVDQATGTAIDPTVPFELKVYFVVRSDPIVPTPDNVYTYAQLTWNDYPISAGKSYMEVFPAPPYSWNNSADVDVSAYALVATPGNAEVRVQSYTLEKQFVGYENIGSFTNQSLSTTSDVQFKSVTVPGTSGDINLFSSGRITGSRLDIANTTGDAIIAMQAPAGNNVTWSSGGTTNNDASVGLLANNRAFMTLGGNNQAFTTYRGAVVNAIKFGVPQSINPTLQWCIEQTAATNDMRIAYLPLTASRLEPLIIEPDLVTASKLNINGQYTLPDADGTVGQSLTTDGSGTVTWDTPAERSFAEIAILNNALATTIAAVDQWIPVAGSAINGPRSADFTPIGPAIAYTGSATKTFRVSANVSWECENKQDLCGLGIQKNANIIASSEQNANVDDNNTYPRNCSSSCIVSLSASDLITVAVRNRNDVDNILVSWMNLTITEI